MCWPSTRLVYKQKKKLLAWAAFFVGEMTVGASFLFSFFKGSFQFIHGPIAKNMIVGGDSPSLFHGGKGIRIRSIKCRIADFRTSYIALVDSCRCLFSFLIRLFIHHLSPFNSSFINHIRILIYFQCITFMRGVFIESILLSITYVELLHFLQQLLFSSVNDGVVISILETTTFPTEKPRLFCRGFLFSIALCFFDAF